jgi:phospholipase/lecithinase/hemolysin
VNRISRLTKAIALGACAAGALLGVSSAKASVYSAEYVFGDSLSDRGNLAELAGFNFPNPPSYHDSFTNGPVAVQGLAQSFGLNADPSLWVTGFQDPHDLFGGASFVPGTNYAVAAATSALQAVGGPPGINLPEQIGAYSAFEHGVADPSALYVIMIGGNDVRNAALQGTGAAAVAAGVDAELAAVRTLSIEDAKHFLVVNVPDVGNIPEFAQDNPTLAGAATTYTQLYNLELAAGLAAIDPTLGPGTSLDEFNLYNFDASIKANAASYGFTNTTDRCFTNTPLSAAATPQCGGQGGPDIANFTYWDSIHPTAKVQALWAQGMEQAVPEPSTWTMLLLGFAGMGFAGFTSARRGAAA